MRNRTQSETIMRLSLYLDGRLGEAEGRELEHALETDTELQREYEQLKRSAALLRDSARLPADPFFIERTLNAVRKLEENEATPLSIQGKYLPAVAGLTLLLLVTVGVFTWWQSGKDIVRYVENTGDKMQRIYEDNILKGWIMPLFQRTDQDRMLQFAMFGTLPLDSAENTTLRVDPASSDGYRVELASTNPAAAKQATIGELYERIRPTSAQRKSFDTLFMLAQQQIESSVLLDQRHRIAIDPGLPQYQRILLTGIASQLDQQQRKSFQRYLSDHNTAYTFSSNMADLPQPPRPARVFRWNQRPTRSMDFVVLAPDSVGMTTVNLNMDSLRKLMVVIEKRLPRMEQPVLQLVRYYTDQAARPAWTNVSTQGTVRVLPPEAPEMHSTISVAVEDFIDSEGDIDAEFERLARDVVVLRHETMRPPPPPPPPGGRSIRERGTDRTIRVRVSDERKREAGRKADSALKRAFEKLEKLDVTIDVDIDSIEKKVEHLELRYFFESLKNGTINLDSLLRHAMPNPDGLPGEMKLEMQRMEKEIQEQRRIAPPEYHVPYAPPTPTDQGPHKRARVRVTQDTSVNI